MDKAKSRRPLLAVASPRHGREVITERDVGLEIDAILQRLEAGIAREKVAMSALLSSLRTTRIAV